MAAGKSDRLPPGEDKVIKDAEIFRLPTEDKMETIPTKRQIVLGRELSKRP